MEGRRSRRSSGTVCCYPTQALLHPPSDLATSKPLPCPPHPAPTNAKPGRFSRPSSKLPAPGGVVVGRGPSAAPSMWPALLEARRAGRGKERAGTAPWPEGGQRRALDLSRLFLGRRFASGSHSRLYLGIYDDEAVAVKVTRPPCEDPLLSDRLQRLFRQEIRLHSSLRHQNVVKFVGACKEPGLALCVVTEYMAGGSLREFLSKARAPLPPEQLVGMAVDIALGMEYLHGRGVIHRDLKPGNLLLTHDLRVKVADFGIACEEAGHDLRWGEPGTYRWMAPEMISLGSCTRKADVFSFGFVLYELITRRLPFHRLTAAQAAYAVLQKSARPKIPLDCPLPLAKLIARCWSSNPKQRPEFTEVLGVLRELRRALKQ